MTLLTQNCVVRDREYPFFHTNYTSWNWRDESILYLVPDEIFSMHSVRHDEHEESRKRSASPVSLRETWRAKVGITVSASSSIWISALGASTVSLQVAPSR